MASNKKQEMSQEKKDLIGNKILCLLTVCFISMAVLMFLNRVIDNLSTMMVTYIVLRALAVISAVAVIVLAFYFVKCRKDGKDESTRVITSSNLLKTAIVFTLSVCFILLFHINAIKVLYVLLPMYAALYLIYHTYPLEFFYLSLGSCIGVLFLLGLYKLEGHITFQPFILPAAIVFGVLAIISAGRVLYLKFAHKKGVKIFRKSAVSGKKMNIWFFLLLDIVFAAGCFIYPFYGSMILYYACYAIGAIFLAGVLFYTYKLMSE